MAYGLTLRLLGLLWAGSQPCLRVRAEGGREGGQAKQEHIFTGGVVVTGTGLASFTTSPASRGLSQGWHLSLAPHFLLVPQHCRAEARLPGESHPCLLVRLRDDPAGLLRAARRRPTGGTHASSADQLCERRRIHAAPLPRTSSKHRAGHRHLLL